MTYCGVWEKVRSGVRQVLLLVVRRWTDLAVAKCCLPRSHFGTAAARHVFAVVVYGYTAAAERKVGDMTGELAVVVLVLAVAVAVQTLAIPVSGSRYCPAQVHVLFPEFDLEPLV